MENKAKCTVTAHSGSMHTEPNSIESIRAGFDIGADITEIDVRFNQDGVPILTHDKAGNEAPVTLSEAFDVIRQYPGRKVNLDIKETANLPAIRTLAREKNVLDQIFFTGVWPHFVAAVREVSTGIPYYLNKNFPAALNKSSLYIDYLIHMTKKSGAIGINLEKSRCSEKLVKKFHEENLLVSIWTITDVQTAKTAIALGTDNITCKNPDEVLALIGKH